jgi:hypothetical protein
MKNKVIMAAMRGQEAICALSPDERPWSDLTKAEQDSLTDGARFYVDNPEAESADGHTHWMARRLDEGWTPSPVKVEGLMIDPLHLLKQHPALIAWNRLDEAYKAKHRAFRKAVLAAVTAG